MHTRIREIKESEYPLLTDFLYEAIFVPDGVVPPPRSILASPDLQVYINRFGAFDSDYGLVAETKGKIVGAIWARIMKDYGHIDDKTPSFAMALIKEYRGLGIGTKLMKAMLLLLKEKGYQGASLSVQKTNYALKLYQRMGFITVAENAEEYIMRISLVP